MSRTYRLAGSIVLAASLSLLSACSILPKPEQVDVYWLPYAQTPIAASHSAPVNWSLRLDKPMASNALNSQNIAVVPEGNLISNYKGRVGATRHRSCCAIACWMRSCRTAAFRA